MIPSLVVSALRASSHAEPGPCTPALGLRTSAPSEPSLRSPPPAEPALRASASVEPALRAPVV